MDRRNTGLLAFRLPVVPLAVSLAATIAFAQAPAGPPAQPFAPQPAAAPVAWSAVVGAGTLESEIRKQAEAIDAALRDPNPQKAVRRELTYLAALYGVVDRYDQAVAWKSEAHAARDTYARSADLAKTWNEFRALDIAKRLRALTEHLRGKNEQFPAALPRDAPWPSFAARPPLMHRLEQGHIERLTNWTRDADTVKKNAAAVAREAEIIAMLARILQDPGYEFGPEKRYQRFARELEQAARDCLKAVERGEGSGAIRAYVGMQRACDACHGEYR